MFHWFFHPSQPFAGGRKKKRSENDAIAAKHARDRAITDKQALQKRLDAILDEQRHSHPKAFVEAFDELLHEAEPDKALELARRYAETQTPALRKVALVKAEAAMMNYAEDGAPALEEARRFAAQGLAFSPSDQALKRLLIAIEHEASAEKRRKLNISGS